MSFRTERERERERGYPHRHTITTTACASITRPTSPSTPALFLVIGPQRNSNFGPCRCMARTDNELYFFKLQCTVICNQVLPRDRSLDITNITGNNVNRQVFDNVIQDLKER
eukprot:TRINITY_DN1008_c0_g1_i6.p1 TRINITY_DN1008_c0_g1~~TRINITY_DN1008_c0_g1_i6.p1  ORF type:complete len:112 (-),score=6.19 TRINITY_DN1008_c0_g1_i6:140-475(-)